MPYHESRNRLCHIMENITDFEFRTFEALQLKQNMRQWYYGGQDNWEAGKLLGQFNSLFSGNMFLDAAGELLWSVVNESPLKPDDSLNRSMSVIPRREIIGRSVRAYGITADGIRYQFEKWESDARGCVDNALENISQHLQRERDWRKNNRMTLLSAVVSLAGIVSLAGGVWFLLPHVGALVKNRDLHDLLVGLPSSRRWDPGMSLIFLVFFTLVTGRLLFLLRRMFLTLRAGLLWTLYHRGRYKLRCKRVKQFRRNLENSGFRKYCEKIQSAADLLAELPLDAPQNLDPSRKFLGRIGMDKVFQGFSLRPLSRGWVCERFYSQVESCHVRSRAGIIILCVALVILRDLMLVGPIMTYLQGLI